MRIITALYPTSPGQVASSECVSALDCCEWDVHRALKLLRLLLLLPHYQRLETPPQQEQLSTARQTLQAFGWDVARAASYISTTTHAEDSLNL